MFVFLALMVRPAIWLAPSEGLDWKTIVCRAQHPLLESSCNVTARQPVDFLPRVGAAVDPDRRIAVTECLSDAVPDAVVTWLRGGAGRKQQQPTPDQRQRHTAHRATLQHQRIHQRLQLHLLQPSGQQGPDHPAVASQPDSALPDYNKLQAPSELSLAVPKFVPPPPVRTATTV
ncbi:unnamed protein product [Arctogadus glacialis]